jgi:hypothetical protein
MENKAAVSILVTIPAVDPCLLIGTGTLVDGIGGIQKVINGDVSEHTTVLFASLLGSLVRDSGNGEEFMVVVADFVLAILLLMAALLVIFLVVHAMRGSIAMVLLHLVILAARG